MAAFSLRPARPGDGAEIARLVQVLAEYERLAHEMKATPAAYEAALFGTPARAHAMLAEIDGRPVGLALWFYNFSTFTGRHGLYLEDLFVEPEHRNLGIGRAFFRALAAEALAQGCPRMEWSVLDWNEPAVRFYRGMGAVGMDDWTVQRLTGDALQKLAEKGA